MKYRIKAYACTTIIKAYACTTITYLKVDIDNYQCKERNKKREIDRQS